MFQWREIWNRTVSGRDLCVAVDVDMVTYILDAAAVRWSCCSAAGWKHGRRFLIQSINITETLLKMFVRKVSHLQE